MADEVDEIDGDAFPFDDAEPTGRQFSQEVHAIAKQVRDDTMPEWSGNSEDNEEFVDLTPDGQAVLDGAFSIKDLYRVAEAAAEAQRRCAPALGDPPMPPLSSAPVALAALHRLRFTVGAVAGTASGILLEQAEQAVARSEVFVHDTAEVSHQRQAKIEALSQKLGQVRAVIEAERNARAVGGTVIDPAIIDQLYEALQSPV